MYLFSFDHIDSSTKNTSMCFGRRWWWCSVVLCVRGKRRTWIKPLTLDGVRKPPISRCPCIEPRLQRWHETYHCAIQAPWNQQESQIKKKFIWTSQTLAHSIIFSISQSVVYRDVFLRPLPTISRCGLYIYKDTSTIQTSVRAIYD